MRKSRKRKRKIKRSLSLTDIYISSVNVRESFDYDYKLHDLIAKMKENGFRPSIVD